MDTRHGLRRLFKSQWTQIFGPALIVLELLAVAAASVTGDWNLTWVFPLLMAFILLRIVLIGLLLFWPVLIAVIVVWAVYTRSKKKQQKKTNPKAPTERGTTTSDGAQQKKVSEQSTKGE